MPPGSGPTRRATDETKRKIEELVAELAPRPDVPPVIRKLPERKLPVPAAPSRPTKARANSCRQELPAPAAAAS